MQTKVRPHRYIGSFLFALVMLGAAVWYIITALGIGQTKYTTVQRGLIGIQYSGDALIVRNETIYDEDGVSDIEYIADEGSTVYRGTTICNVYTSGYSANETAKLRNYRQQIKEYQQELVASESGNDLKLARYASDVQDRALELRQMIWQSSGNMSYQERLLSSAIDLKQTYIRQKYPDDKRLSRLYDDENTQVQRIESWIKPYSASENCIVSFYTDNFEYILTTANYMEFTPQQVRSYIGGALPEISSVQRGRTAIFRTVKQGTYAVLMLADDKDWNPTVGNAYQLVLSDLDSSVVSATVTGVTRSGRELLVRLEVKADVDSLLYLRTCRVGVGEYQEGLIVPDGAITEQDGVSGVIAVVNGESSFVQVNVILRREGYSMIRPVANGALYEGQAIRVF